jgi:hypothetical protein
MKRWLHFLFLILAAGFTAVTFTAAIAADKLENIPLEFTPTSPMSERDPLDMRGAQSVKLQVDPFTDAREDAVLIGQNMNKVPLRKVTTRDDVPRFVTYHVISLLSGIGIGLDVVESGGTIILKGEVKKFFAQETNRYNATVELRITLSDPEGKVLWAVETTGTSSRFGIGYKAANYYEVLSDALVGAVHELAGNPNFKRTLAGK